MKNEKVLVTGGAGYAGSVLVPMLIERGYSVSIVDKLLHDNSYNLFLTSINGKPIQSHPNFLGFTKGDVADKGLMKKLVEEHDSVIHLAAIVGAPASKKFPEETKRTNVEGTNNILEFLKPSQKIVYASTGSVYGKVDGICTEESSLNPTSLYGETKFEAEQAVIKKGGVAYRFATAFGLSPRLRLDLLPNDFSQKMLMNNALDIFEEDAQRTFIHVNDMAESYLFALENYDKMKGNAYNIGNEKMNMSKKELTKVINKVLIEKTGSEAKVWEAEGRIDPDQRDYVVDYSKIQKIGNGFFTKISMEEGVSGLIDFFHVYRAKDPFRNI